MKNISTAPRDSPKMIIGTTYLHAIDREQEENIINLQTLPLLFCHRRLELTNTIDFKDTQCPVEQH